jgi:integrase/recombinase XerD
MSGQLSYKIKIKDDYVRSDGTCSLYLQLFLNRVQKRIPLNLSVVAKYFDKKKQRVKSGQKSFKDFNLLIEKKLAEINAIEINYRLAGKILNMELLINEMDNPSATMDFIGFWENEMIRQKEILKDGTYKQQLSILNKIKEYKNPILFSEINDGLIEDLKIYCKKKLKNAPVTIGTLIKSFKKYLHIANKKGIATELRFDDIKNQTFKSNRTYLLPEDIVKMNAYWESQFINDTHKNILSRFLFSCFTGLRLFDVKSLTSENFIEDTLVFTAEKTGKFQRIPMNKSAKKFITPESIFDGQYTDQYINRELKEIAKFLGIRKNISFHVSRHTFATNFLMQGGRVEHLQKLLAHSKIDETMIYVHIVEQITNLQIHNMDEILK